MSDKPTHLYGIPIVWTDKDTTPDVRKNRSLAEQLTREVHSDVVMSEAAWRRVCKQKDLGRAGALTHNSVGEAWLFGMRLTVRKTEVGAELAAYLLAAVDGKTVLWIRDDGHGVTVRGR